MTAVSPVKDNRRESAGPGTKSNTENSRKKNKARNVTIIIKNYFFKESVSDSVGSIFYAICFFATLIKPESFLETFTLI